MGNCKMFAFPSMEDRTLWLLNVCAGYPREVRCTEKGVVIYASSFDQLPALVENARQQMRPILATGVRA